MHMTFENRLYHKFCTFITHFADDGQAERFDVRYKKDKETTSL